MRMPFFEFLVFEKSTESWQHCVMRRPTLFMSSIILNGGCEHSSLSLIWQHFSHICCENEFLFVINEFISPT